MSDRPPTIFISAAEASGDERAGQLVKAIRDRLSSVRVIGVGGEAMAAAGCEILLDLTHRASMVGAVVPRLVYYIRTIKRLQKQIREIRPDVHVPVDSPGINWHLAAAAKSCGSAVVHYIAPQVWAWAPWRVKKLRRLTDHVACILPFEERYLWDRGVKATYIGHPLFDTLPPQAGPLADLVEAWSRGTWRVALLPGSRPAEIRNHTAALLSASKVIRQRWPDARCTFAARTPLCAETISRECNGAEVEIAVGKTREVLSGSHFAVAVSGTVTLEAAHFGVPMVILYRTNRLGYELIGRWLLRTPHLSLVNILAGRRLVPELMPWHGSHRKLNAMVTELMEDLGCLFETRQSLIELVRPLRAVPPATAAGNAADLVLDVMERRRT